MMKSLSVMTVLIWYPTGGLSGGVEASKNATLMPDMVLGSAFRIIYFVADVAVNTASTRHVIFAVVPRLWPIAS